MVKYNMYISLKKRSKQNILLYITAKLAFDEKLIFMWYVMKAKKVNWLYVVPVI